MDASVERGYRRVVRILRLHLTLDGVAYVLDLPVDPLGVCLERINIVLRHVAQLSPLLLLLLLLPM